jgi:hypothetical protein
LDTDARAGSEAQQHLQKGVQLAHELRYELAQLDLLASRQVRRIARRLAAAHEREVSRLMATAQGQDDAQGWSERKRIGGLHDALVEWTRADLGLDAVTAWHAAPRGLIRKLEALFNKLSARARG